MIFIVIVIVIVIYAAYAPLLKWSISQGTVTDIHQPELCKLNS